MKINNISIRIIVAIVTFTVTFGIATLAVSFAQSEDITDDTIATCKTDIFKYDKEQIFEDVALNDSYNHVIHFLAVLNPSIATKTESNSLPNFFPNRAITLEEFAKALRSYFPLFEKPNTAWMQALPAQKMNAKIRQKDIAKAINAAFGLPSKTVLAEFRKNKIRSKWVRRKETAYILFKAAEKILQVSPEEAACKTLLRK